MAPAADLRGLHTGRHYQLAAAPFDSGGGGGVYRVQGDCNVVAKLFASPCAVTDETGRRLNAVLAKAITSRHLARLVDLLVSTDDWDTLVGYVMDRVVGHTLYSVTNPDERRQLTITLSPLDRIKLAWETALTFEALHTCQQRLGDAHHRNLMVTFDRRGRVAGVVALEPDTWIFEWRTAGILERFTSMARSDFLPPEFQGVNLGRTPLTYASDRFALTLNVSLALFDCTPYAFAGSTLAVEDRIRKGVNWVTGTLPPGATPPDRLPIDPAAVPDVVMALMRRGLSATPAERPTAAEFVLALADWHRDTVDGSVSARFLAALVALIQARSFGSIWRRSVEAFFAALDRFLRQPGETPIGRWPALAVRLALLALIVAMGGLWFLVSGDARNPSPTPAIVPASHANWRSLVETTDPPPE